MIIDFHTHAFPDVLAQKAIPVLEKNGSIKALHNGTVSGLVATMDRDGIDKAVVLSIATKPSQENSVNTFAISLLENPRIIPFGSVYPGSDTWEFQLEGLKSAGIRGIKLHPEYQGFDLDCEDALRVYDKCGKIGLIVSFHSGEDAAYEPPVHTGARRINKVCEMFPKTVFVAAHMGGYNMWDDSAENIKPFDNLYLDTSMTQTEAKIDIETAKKILKKHGPEHLLLGSDSPWEKQSDSVNAVLKLGLSSSDAKLVLGESANRLLNM